MKMTCLKIIQRNNIVISIKYDNGNEDYYRRIHPYYIFSIKTTYTYLPDMKTH